VFFTLFFAVIFAAMGADGSYGTSIQSFFVWVPTILVAMLALLFSHVILHNRLKVNFWFLSTLEGMLGALFFAPFAYFLDVFLGADQGPLLSIKGIIEEYGNVLPSVVICWLLMKSPRYFGLVLPSKIDRKLAASPFVIDQANASCEIGEAFLEILPPELGTDVIFIKAEKQYIMVTTTLGSRLVNYGLGQAINSFAEEYGYRIHRSIWVSKKHIRRIDKKLRTVTMSNDATLPISRRLLSAMS
jgi:hypothetical protein